ncbi:MAG: Fe-S cluster assembly ATPase SufC, partial [Candidatus Margulisbacteria bacterium]|nr:Fe-S cluster assembly ATPase SufC [Candidatus Margulisiibacteriota bacterium]
LAGDPSYEVTGDITFLGEDILEMEPDERALRGLFLAFQYPVEIPGVNNASFLRMAYNAKMKHLKKDEMDPMEFEVFLKEKLKLVKMPLDFMNRQVNHGFSGGEKKRNEIVQCAVLEPKLSILDETDSGLDIDALKTVAEGINTLKKPDNAILMITHYQRILEYVTPDVVHVMIDGRITQSGDKSLALSLEETGYEGMVSK